MRSTMFKASLIKSALAVSTLLLASGVAMASTVTLTLTATPTGTLLPDGQTVPMWGYACGATSVDASCLAPNGSAQSILTATTGWQPPLITVPGGVGSSLVITLTNSLTFTGASVPTSLVIVGQLGGGLGTGAVKFAAPVVHAPQGTSWPGTRGDVDASSCTSADPLAPGAAGTFCPPSQEARVRSLATEVAAGTTNSTLQWDNLRPGTYLIESGTEPSIQGPMGLYAMLVVTDPLATPLAPQAYGQLFDKDVALLLSEIDPVQNAAVTTAVNTAGFSDTFVWDGQPGKCGDAAVHTCYPPAVNYTPLYYLINGVSFDRNGLTNPVAAVGAAGASGNVLLRFVNAGLHMHVPSVVGASLTLLAEDGNKLPGKARVQNEVFLAAGKTYDVTIRPTQGSAGTNDAATYAVFDRALGLSTSGQPDGGMQAYIQVNGGGAAPAAPAVTAATKAYFCVAGSPLVVSDASLGLLGGSTGANGVALTSFAPANAADIFSLQSSGTFTYAPDAASTSCGGTINYSVNGTLPKSATITQCQVGSVGAGCVIAAAPVVGPVQFVSNISSRYASSPPGVLAGVTTNTGGYPLTAVGAASGVTLNPDGSFVATSGGPSVACPAFTPALPAGASCVQFNYQAKTSQGALSNTSTATVAFLPASNLVVNVRDSKTPKPTSGTDSGLISDYRWIIEEDKTFWVDPKCQINTTATRLDSNGRACDPLPVESIGYNFHTANMPVVAEGCVGAVSCEAGQLLLGAPAACDIGNGVCRTTAAQKVSVLPGAVYLDPLKRYYISVLPGDGVNTTIGGAGGPHDDGTLFSIATDCGPYVQDTSLTGTSAWAPGAASAVCGHAMGGAQIAAANGANVRPPIDINLQETPLPSAKVSAFIFEDDNPLNGENDAGGGVDIIAPNEPGLGGFEVVIYDLAGGFGDVTGQITYDMFNMPVSNALAGYIDPVTKLNACPITNRTDGLVGMIPTCPHFESDGRTESPLEGQVVVDHLYPGLYELEANPAADRIARGEEWLQTNTLDGSKPHEVFLKPNEPSYFQEFGPGGFHVAIGFARPDLINAQRMGTGKGICDPANIVNGVNEGGGGMTCGATLTVQVTNAHMSRTPDQRIYSSADYSAYGFTQCYVSVGPPDSADFAFAKCDADGKATFTNMPVGNWKLTVFDQWNDLMLDGLVFPVTIDNSGVTKEYPVTQWRTNLYTNTYFDANGNGLRDDGETGLPLLATNIRYRDGSFGFFNNTDLEGAAGFNEVFPFMNWLVVESDMARYKSTGTHVVYDSGGPVDCTTPTGVTPAPKCTTVAGHIASTAETISLPATLRVPGAVYCADADCSAQNRLTNPTGGGTDGSTGRIDPPWAITEGWQGLLGQNSFMDFGRMPFAAGENGGIRGHVIYASTRPFDDPTLSLQLSWEPGVPRVRINLYQENTAADGTKTLTLVDYTTTSSWDDWSQGFRTDGVPNMNCPGEDPTSPFFQTLRDSKQWLDPLKRSLPGSTTDGTTNAQFKCYDGWSQLNQAQPAPYDGMYKFPSVTARNTGTGQQALTDTNCTICTAKPADPRLTTDYDAGAPMLPVGRYVVEVIVPPGYELVKEEDKNILLGDVYIAPVTTQFAGLGDIYIMPDQAAVGAHYNANNPGSLNLTDNMGATPRHEGDTGSVESFWPCVGAVRTVPELNSLFPGAGQASPFAGATRHLCDRKEVILEEQATVLAKFYIFSSTHIAGHFTGLMTNDFAAEFDPFSPQFGEKFGPPNLPVGMRDFNGNEMSRVYADQWGVYNGLFFSTYGVNPPNPTGYVPQMSIACMNDPGPVARTNALGQFIIKNPVTGTETVVASANLADQITDPAYSPAYSNFCYETPFMPGFTAYMDTPVIPTQAFADGYNLPDSEYPDATPAIASVKGSSATFGPWVGGSGQRLTITALGDKVVQNPNFSGPNAATAPYDQKTLTRHYGFGATRGRVTIGGVTANVATWTDTTIVVTVPSDVPTCRVQQRGQPNARCGELEITAANGKKSIDTVTVTVGGKAPTYVTPTSTNATTAGQPNPYGVLFPNPLQTAIDKATPGDLIMVGPGTYRENLIMWKPVRLQGVGAASVTINADAHPAGKMDPWRRQVNCLFGLTLDGATNLNNTAYDSTHTYTCPAAMFLRTDHIPFEGFVGWDASSNGNLAQVLQEPSLMGAYEGAGVTVLGRGVQIPATSSDFWGLLAVNQWGGNFPDGSRYLTSGSTTGTSSDCTGSLTRQDGRDYGTGNYLCNPSRIDGVSIINSSQGGGGIFMHGWNHNLEVANTRIYGNHGTLSGGINLGNPENPPVYVNDGTVCGAGAITFCPPFGAASLIGAGTPPANGLIPFQFNTRVRVHHNEIINNASIGDALFTGTPSGAGGITVAAGADLYQVDHNWIAGNLTTGDGAGIVHSGVSVNGKLANNWVLFNQSTNPTLPTNGGGIAIVGANNDRTLPNGLECGTTVDLDCPPGISDGVGPGLVIDGNLIMGNSAETGSGGGLRLQQLNGSEVAMFPTTPSQWYSVSIINNIIVNNVAGWDGGGVSMQDSLKVSFVNNTVSSNDTTASSGVLFKTLGAINSSAPPPNCTPNPDPSGTTQDPGCTQLDAPHNPQPAGFVTQAHTPNLIASLPGTVTCPTSSGNGSYPYSASNNGNCRRVSIPILKNDMFWQNRAFRVDIVGPGTGLISQQNLVALTPLLNQQTTGSCETGANYWDVGVRQDDLALADGSGTAVLTLNNSILSDTTHPRITGSGNYAPAGSPVVGQYCNGARVPPEGCSANPLAGAACLGYNAPPGRSETTGLSTVFVFNNITAAATVDEGHNWLNLTYGPLTMTRVSAVGPTAVELMVAAASVGSAGGAYSPNSGSFNNGLPRSSAGVPDHDYFNMARPLSGVTVGAVQFRAGPTVSDLSVTKTDGVSTIRRGTALTYTIVVTNNGPGAVTSVVVHDNRPAQITNASWNWTCTGTGCGPNNNSGTSNINKMLGILASGGSVTFTVHGTVTTNAANAPNGSSLSNTVSLTLPSGTTDTNPANNTATDVDTVNNPAATLTGSGAFGSAQVGTTTASHTFTYTSTGNVSITVNNVTLSGTNSMHYTITSNGCAGATLAPSQSCAVNVAFRPMGTGSRTANLVISDTAGGAPNQTLGLTGTGKAPVLALACPSTCTGSGSTYPYGAVTGSASASFTLSNIGTNAADFVIASIGVTKTNGGSGTYSVTGGTCTAGNTLAANGSCTVVVQFSSATSSSTNGTISVSGSGVGTGAPNYAVSRNVNGS